MNKSVIRIIEVLLALYQIIIGVLGLTVYYNYNMPLTQSMICVITISIGILMLISKTKRTGLLAGVINQLLQIISYVGTTTYLYSYGGWIGMTSNFKMFTKFDYYLEIWVTPKVSNSYIGINLWALLLFVIMLYLLKRSANVNKVIE